MAWATERRALIIGVVVVILVVILGAVAFLSLHRAPSCTDGRLNQDEEGIDCGGSCTYVCAPSVLSPVVSFVRPVFGLSGRTDIVAYVENPNPFAAAQDAAYEIELFNTDREVLARRFGTVDLPPASGVPIFIPNVYLGEDSVAQVFLTFDDRSLKWYRFSDTRIIPEVESVREEGTQERPRVSATLINPSPETLRSFKVVATVFGDNDTVIAASETLIAELAPRGSTSVVFTWSAPFSEVPSRIDVRPVIALPNEIGLP